MKIDQRFPTRFLTKNDVTNGLTACMDRVEVQDLKTPNGQTESRPVLLLRDQKPLVLNKSNYVTIADLYGDDDDGWSGHWVTLYHDSTISFGGKRVGGIRVKQEKPAPEVSVSGAGDPEPAGGAIAADSDSAATVLPF